VANPGDDPSQILLQAAIQRLIPHRYPFLFIDRVTEFIPGQRIAGLKHFAASDEVCQGDATGQGLVPATVLTEMVTQLGAILVYAQPHMAEKIAVILSVPYSRLLKPVYAGDSLRVEAEVLRMRQDFGEMVGRAYREDELVAEGQLRFAVAPVTVLQSRPGLV
jgi:3-hydroxymyristoyl/3-hydroxydecanoyl-(acyl carrier protein) dehydratase